MLSPVILSVREGLATVWWDRLGGVAVIFAFATLPLLAAAGGRMIKSILLYPLWADRTGATALEYGFFVAFVAAVLLGGAMELADSVETIFSQVSSKFTDKVNRS